MTSPLPLPIRLRLPIETVVELLFDDLVCNRRSQTRYEQSRELIAAALVQARADSLVQALFWLTDQTHDEIRTAAAAAAEQPKSAAT